MVDRKNRFVRLPSLNDFDLPGIKLDLFKKYDPKIVSIAEAQNNRKHGHEYEKLSFKSLCGKEIIEVQEIETPDEEKQITPQSQAVGSKRSHQHAFADQSDHGSSMCTANSNTK